ncbi:sensor histidine kinase [Candidatus Uhrbacteria bacterium]|nr:sensor histidine kinase [Candidatus Uhrbacteria bacterium]
MKVHLPNSAFIGNIEGFLRNFDPFDSEKLEITANKNWISLHPLALSMIAILGLSVKDENVLCEKLEATSKHYLERMGLFKFLGIDSGMRITSHESAGRFIPLTQIKNTDELGDLLTEMIPLLHLSPEQTDPIRYILSEMVRNVLEHAQSPHGAVLSAQYHSKSNMIRIGIADTGVGIKSTITRSHVADTDLDALRLALTPGITGTTSREGGTDWNAGAGLFFTKSIAAVNRTHFMLYSGDALYKLLKPSKTQSFQLNADPFDDRHTKKEHLPQWQGTAVGIDIALDTSDQFNVLLDSLRSVWSSAIQKRKQARRKIEPKFI